MTITANQSVEMIAAYNDEGYLGVYAAFDEYSSPQIFQVFIYNNEPSHVYLSVEPSAVSGDVEYQGYNTDIREQVWYIAEVTGDGTITIS